MDQTIGARDRESNDGHADGENGRSTHERTARLGRSTLPMQLARWLRELAARAEVASDRPQLHAQRDDHDIEAIAGAAFVIARDGIVVNANRSALALTGRFLAEIVGSRIDAHVSSREPQAVLLHTRDGGTLPVELWVSWRANDTMVATLRPLANDASNMREQDVAEVVHDMRGPLSTIALEVTIVQLRLAASGGKVVEESIARIKQNIEFLDRMLYGLLDIAVLGSGQLELRRRDVDLVVVVSDTIARTVSTRDRDRIRFAPRGAIIATIDDLRIGRAIANLVGNAVKYAPRASEIAVAIEERSGAARITVTDIGPGLTAEEAIYVFDKYRRTASAAAREGTGLGLYVSRKIVEAHGGRIGVERVGQGSRFYIELPLG